VLAGNPHLVLYADPVVADSRLTRDSRTVVLVDILLRLSSASVGFPFAIIFTAVVA
jgi:hypothetical protein